MKILAFGDNHGKGFEKVKAKASQADLLICIGDITNFETRIKEIMQEIASWNKKVLMIHGNHEDEKVMRRLCEKYDNIFFIHDGLYRTDSYIFIGWGGGGFSYQDELFEQKANEYKQFIKGHKFVLILHQPPNGYVDTVGGSHTGNISFTKFIEETQPELAFCGHIHDCSGKTAKLGKTTIVNVLPEGMMFEI